MSARLSAMRLARNIAGCRPALTEGRSTRGAGLRSKDDDEEEGKPVRGADRQLLWKEEEPQGSNAEDDAGRQKEAARVARVKRSERTFMDANESLQELCQREWGDSRGCRGDSGAEEFSESGLRGWF